MTVWTDFVKSFAEKNNMSYGCALSKPECSAGYRAKYGNKKPLGKKKEKELMAMEDINKIIKPSNKTPERKEKFSNLKQKINKKKTEKQLVETTGMMAEDVNRYIPVQDLAGNFVDVPTVREKKNRGRPKKYATAEEARKAKIANTIASAKKRKLKVGGAIGIEENSDAPAIINAINSLLNREVNNQVEARAVDNEIRQHQVRLRVLLSPREYRLHRDTLNRNRRYIRIFELCNYTIDEANELVGGGIINTIASAKNRKLKKGKGDVSEIQSARRIPRQPPLPPPGIPPPPNQLPIAVAEIVTNIPEAQVIPQTIQEQDAERLSILLTNRIRELLGERRGKGIIQNISNTVKNVVKSVVYGRNDYSPKVLKIISQYGDKIITGINLHRTPLGTPLMTALQIASGNTFSQKLKNTPYDKLFHLFMCIDFAGKSMVLEKNEVINAENNCKLPKETESKIITSSDIPAGLTLNDALEKTRERMGSKYLTYSAKDNNCQDFIIAFLTANNIGSETDKSWVKQETKVLFEGNDRLRKIANTLTDIGARVDVLRQGGGLKKGKGLEKKSPDNNIGMANKWIEYVKAYAKKNNIKYNEALKDPKMKAGYKKGGAVHTMPDGTVMAGATHPKKRGGRFNLISTLKDVGKKIGEPFKPVVGVNPFTTGFDLGHDVIGPALLGKGVQTDRGEYIAQLYDQANLGANGRVNLN